MAGSVGHGSAGLCRRRLVWRVLDAQRSAQESTREQFMIDTIVSTLARQLVLIGRIHRISIHRSHLRTPLDTSLGSIAWMPGRTSPDCRLWRKELPRSSARRSSSLSASSNRISPETVFQCLVVSTRQHGNSGSCRQSNWTYLSVTLTCFSRGV